MAGVSVQNIQPITYFTMPFYWRLKFTLRTDNN